MQSDPTIWVVDRIEDGTQAVLISEDGAKRQELLGSLPAGVREGHALRELPGGGYEIDSDETDRLLREAKRLRESLRRGPSGPISL